VQTLLLPYNALGLSLAAFLPLAIYFIFLEVIFMGEKYKTVRKSGWILIFVVFVFLWFSRAPELATASGYYASWVYPITALLCLIFFWFDGTIQKWLNKFRADRGRERGHAHLINVYGRALDKINATIRDGGEGLENYSKAYAPSGITKGHKAAEGDMVWLRDEISKLHSKE